MALRVVVAGLGQRGRDWAVALRGSTVATLVGGADPDPEARRRAAGDPTLSSVPIDTDLAALIERTRPDAAIVATPPSQHVPLAELTLSHRLATLVEKPLALELGSAVRLVRLGESLGVPLLVAQNYRYMRAHRTVRRIVQEGTLGRLSTVTCHYWRADHAVKFLGAIDMSALWETGVHHLDALRYCLGRRIVGVVADTSTAPWTERLRGTSTRMLLEFEGGVRGEYSVSWDAPGHEWLEEGQQFYERLVGERGTLHVVQRAVVLCLTGRWPRLVKRGARPETEEMQLLRMLQAARAGGPAPDCSGRDNLETIATVAACEESCRTRRWVSPQDLLGQHDA